MEALEALKAMPMEIADAHITLSRDTPPLWDLLARLSEDEIESFASFRMPRTVFSNEAYYKETVAPRRQAMAHGQPILQYWIVDPQPEAVIGAIALSGDEENGKLFKIGGYILPAYRNKGHISRAYNLTCDYMLSRDIASHIAAEVEPDNAPSKRSLLKAAFVACGEGLSSSSPEKMMHRFVRTKNAPAWPFAENVPT